MSNYYECHASIDTTDIDEVYNPLNVKITEIWFVKELYHKYDHGDIKETNIEAVVMDDRHPGFAPIMRGFNDYMKLLDKQNQLEKEKDEYNQYLKLKAKFEDRGCGCNE